MKYPESSSVLNDSGIRLILRIGEIIHILTGNDVNKLIIKFSRLGPNKIILLLYR